jgi:3-phenylpropionate/trans-cinnamate dioxygenase ferredoxin subunit
VNVDFLRVGTVAEIPEGEVRAFDLPTGRVGVAHDERRLFAFAETCPGQGCALTEASFDDRSAQLTCPTCESVFDLETGEPLEGPARDPLTLFSAREDDGWLEVSLQPAR